MDNRKTRIAIVGLGNVGRGVLSELPKNEDMVLAGVVTRRPKEFTSQLPIDKIYSYENLERLEADVAILCMGSATDLPTQGPFFASRFNTADSFDTHSDIYSYDSAMKDACMQIGYDGKRHTSIICAGWDPGTFSLERVLGNALLPGSSQETFWGKGVSQGHSQAVRSIEGVLDGIQYTVPKEEALSLVRSGKTPRLTTRDKHLREVYIAIEPEADVETIVQKIKGMPKYFRDYDTVVVIESPEAIAERRKSMPHGGFVLTSGKTGNGNSALIEYNNRWGSNPESTASILLSCARACNRLSKENRHGSYTMLDFPASYLSPLSREQILKSLM